VAKLLQNGATVGVRFIAPYMWLS